LLRRGLPSVTGLLAVAPGLDLGAERAADGSVVIHCAWPAAGAIS
jgi:hypothetical protein